MFNRIKLRQCISFALLIQATLISQAATWQALSGTGFTGQDLVFGGSYFTDGQYQEKDEKVLTTGITLPSASLSFFGLGQQTTYITDTPWSGPSYSKYWTPPPPQVDIANMRVNFSALSRFEWVMTGTGIPYAIVGWGVGSHNHVSVVHFSLPHCSRSGCTPGYETPPPPSTDWDWVPITDNGDGTYTASWITPVPFQFGQGGEHVSLTFKAAPATVSLVGDKDDFHTGDASDIPTRSQRVQDLLYWIAANPDQDPGVNLDEGKGVGFGYNRPVGFSHNFSIPPGAKITAATLKLRVKASEGSDSFYNDGIVYEPLGSLPVDQQLKKQASSYSKSFKDDANCSVPSNYDPINQINQIDLGLCKRDAFYPYITLRDLLGYEPYNNETYLITINLGKVPLRTAQLPGITFGSHWSNTPDEYRNLLGFLADGQFDMIVGDDSQIDYSTLEVDYVLPGAPIGDLTGDGKIDKSDLNLLMKAVGTKSYGPDDPRDLNLPKDGNITVLDIRKLTLLCTNIGCAP
jgi:hypothetical protein